MAGLKTMLRRLNCCAPSDSPEDLVEPPRIPAKNVSPESTTSVGDSTTLVISHGAFQTRYHYQLYIDALRSHTDIDRIIVPQQSSSGPTPPPDSFQKDVDVLHETIRTELLAGRDVLLVCHSYGGIPGCEALSDLPNPNDPQIGTFLGTLFVSAFVAEAHQSLITSKKAGRADWVRIEGALSHVNDPGPTLFSTIHTVDPTLTQNLITHLVPQSSASFMAETSHQLWTQYPCCYVRCLRDQAMVVDEQNYFIDRMERLAKTARVRELPADHAPFASMPQRLAELTEEVVTELKTDAASK